MGSVNIAELMVVDGEDWEVLIEDITSDWRLGFRVVLFNGGRNDNGSCDGLRSTVNIAIKEYF